MATLDLSISVDSDDEVRALYQALIRAAATEHAEAARLSTLRGTGYLTNSTDSGASELTRALDRKDALRALSNEVRERMRLAGIEPW